MGIYPYSLRNCSLSPFLSLRTCFFEAPHPLSQRPNQARYVCSHQWGWIKPLKIYLDITSYFTMMQIPNWYVWYDVKICFFFLFLQEFWSESWNELGKHLFVFVIYFFSTCVSLGKQKNMKYFNSNERIIFFYKPMWSALVRVRVNR